MANPETLELIKLVVAGQAAAGGPFDCPLIVWLQQQLDRDADIVRQEMIARKEWEPRFSMYALMQTNSPKAQAAYARHIASAPWSDTRRLVERAFRDKKIELTQEAADILAAKLSREHPNPKAFLMQKDVYETLAPDVRLDVSALRAPDFPDIDRVKGKIGRAGISR